MIDLVLAGFLILFAWPLALFPLWMKWRTRRLTPSPEPAPPEDDLPAVTLIICALNEERVIGAKMENCVALDYPRDRLRIVVINDGSTDGTAAIVRAYQERGITLIDHPERRGKVANLNDVAPAVDTPIVAFSDANVIYDPQALRRLAERFADPGVGGATGRVVLVNTVEAIQSSEQDYYSLEWAVHAGSTAIHSMVGCDGAMYALRRELFTVCPPDTLIEDFVQALAVVRQGKRMVYEPRALAWEEGPQSLREEYRRKVRIAAGAAQALLRGNGWPVGTPWKFWLLWVSHKLLRWLAPVTALAMVVVAASAPESWMARAVLIGTGTLVLMAAARAAAGPRWAWFDAPFYLVFGLTAGLVGLVKGAVGRQRVLWSKASR